jgi:hypothetical protein
MVLLRDDFIQHKEQTSTQYENCALLGFHAANSGNFLADISEIHVGPVFGGQESKKINNHFGFLTLETGRIGCSETSVWKYHSSVRSSSEERSSYVLRSGCLKSGTQLKSEITKLEIKCLTDLF